MPIKYNPLREIKLGTDIVTDVDVISRLLPNSFAVVESQAIYAAMEALSANILNKVGEVAVDPVKDVKLFDYSELPNVVLDNITDTRRVLSSTGDLSNVYTVDGYSNGSQFFRIPSIVKLNNGRYVAIFDVRWNSYEDIGKSNYNDQCIGMVYSDTEGSTWSKPQVIIDWFYPDYNSTATNKEYQSGASDPGILYDEVNDVIMVFALGGYGFMNRQSEITDDVLNARKQQLVFSYSKDHGETWSKPITVNDKIFDADGISQTIIATYRYLFSTCTSGITLKNQVAEQNNGIMLFPVQLNTQGMSSTTWTQTFRIGLLKVEPTYDYNKNIVDIKLTFVGDEHNNVILFGAKCGGANECSICESPTGEIAIAARSNSAIDNSNAIFSSSKIIIKLAKMPALGQEWELIGDIPSGNDKICSTLETAANGTKPGLCWSEQLNMYILGYVQAYF